MNHERFIQNLVEDLSEPSESNNWFSLYWFSWIGTGSIIAFFTYLAMSFLPQDIHLPRMIDAAFWFSSLLWFVLSFSAALTAYFHSLIGKDTSIYKKVTWFSFFLILIPILNGLFRGPMSLDWATELSFMQGPCGGFIFVTGLISLLWMCLVMKRGTPLNLSGAGMWATVSVGALGSGFMHMVCTHEGAVHEFIWHLIPLFLLMAIGAILGKKLIRW